MGRIKASREALEAALARFDDERKQMVILHGEWSVKDLIGHLGFWENQVISVFASLKIGDSPNIFQDVDQMNARALAESRTLSLESVQLLEKNAYEQILQLVQEASDLDLFDPGRFTWTEGRNFEQIISDNTWEHYDEHLPELFHWLKRIA